LLIREHNNSERFGVDEMKDALSINGFARVWEWLGQASDSFLNLFKTKPGGTFQIWHAQRDDSQRYALCNHINDWHALDYYLFTMSLRLGKVT